MPPWSLHSSVLCMFVRPMKTREVCRGFLGGFLLRHAGWGLRSSLAEELGLQGRGLGLEWPRAEGSRVLLLERPQPSGGWMWGPRHAWAGVTPLGVLIKAKEDQLTGVQPVNQAELMVAGVCLELIWGSPRKMGLIQKLLGTLGVILRGTSLQSAPPASLGPPDDPHCGSVLFWACDQHALPSHNAQSRIKPTAQGL